MKHEKKELDALVNLAQKYMWADGETREYLEKHDVRIVRGDFYSPVPSLDELSNSWEDTPVPPYASEEIFNSDFMVSFLIDKLSPFATDFNPPIKDSGVKSDFYWENPLFSFSDAMAYYCMIRHFKPNRIIEIGSGFSTLVARKALHDNQKGEIVSVEPYPSEVLKSVATDIELITKPVQEIDVEFFKNSLRENDILFIDSTHTVKVGGDCLYIYLKILPSLEFATVVHVHDIYLPFMFPKHLLKLQQYWCEQYLLYAYILDNPRIRILYGSKYHYEMNREKLISFMKGKFAPGGASFYFLIN